jgi:hypothetical protein
MRRDVTPRREDGMKVLAGLVILGIAGVAAAAEPAPRRSWEWTLEDRIALRTSAEAAQQRLLVSGRRTKGVAKFAANAKSATVVDSFDGQTHPELFLPYQVFEELVKLSLLSDVRTSQLFREGLSPEVQRYGLPPDFWDRLRTISAIYTADVHAMRNAQLKVAANQKTDSVTDRYRALCRSRAEALAAARAEFGRQRLDRFLYEVIAVNMFSTAFSLPDPALLRQAEEGCR